MKLNIAATGAETMLNIKSRHHKVATASKNAPNFTESNLSLVLTLLHKSIPKGLTSSLACFKLKALIPPAEKTGISDNSQIFQLNFQLCVFS